jgi:hypothetical protein
LNFLTSPSVLWVIEDELIWLFEPKLVNTCPMYMT